VRFLADENIKKEAIDKLREYGYQVDAIFEHYRGLKNGEVLALANELKAILITEDKQFISDLILGKKLAQLGVIFVRLPPKQVTDQEYAQKIVDVVVEYESKLETSLLIVKNNSIRCQSLKQ
jgi:predicted nuclease of predicted toxin-antitoxin system